MRACVRDACAATIMWLCHIGIHEADDTGRLCGRLIVDTMPCIVVLTGKKGTLQARGSALDLNLTNSYV